MMSYGLWLFENHSCMRMQPTTEAVGTAVIVHLGGVFMDG